MGRFNKNPLICLAKFAVSFRVPRDATVEWYKTLTLTLRLRVMLTMFSSIACWFSRTNDSSASCTVDIIACTASVSVDECELGR